MSTTSPGTLKEKPIVLAKPFVNVTSETLLPNRKQRKHTNFLFATSSPKRSVNITDYNKLHTLNTYGSLDSEVSRSQIKYSASPSYDSFDLETNKWAQGCPFKKLIRKYWIASSILLVIAGFTMFVTISLHTTKINNFWIFLRDNPTALKQHSTSLKSGYGFDETLAMQILIYAGAAYEEDEDKLSSCLPSFEMHTRLTAEDSDGNSVKGFTGMYKDEFIIVAVHGTQTNQQLYSEWNNINPENFINHEEAQVVSYFNSIASQMLDDTVYSLNTLVVNCSSCPVYFTGHSLGGATVAILLASIYELDLVLFPTQPQVYTFGQPRCGNKAFSELSALYFDSYRVVNSKDPVVHIPCCNFKIFGNHAYECLDVEGYWSPWHNYQEIYYEDMSELEYTECEGEGEDIDCADSVHWYSYSLNDHYYYYNIMVAYMCSYLLGDISEAEFYYDKNYETSNLNFESLNISDSTSLDRFTCIVF